MRVNLQPDGVNCLARRDSTKSIFIKEKAVKYSLFALSLLSIIAIISIAVYLSVVGIPFIGRVGFSNFFFDGVWGPLLEEPRYGIAAMLVTTLEVTVLSTLLGGALGLLSAIGLYRFTNKHIATALSASMNLLSGIPSVIYGLFGMTFIVPFLRDYVSPNGVGYGVLAATLVLSIMIYPTMVSMSLDALRATDPLIYEGALALGASKERAVVKVSLRAAKSGIMAALILSMGRALGETMAVIMVIGGSCAYPDSLFKSVRTLTSNIAMGATELGGEALNGLVACGLVLFFLTLIINAVFALFRRKFEHA